MNITPSSSLTPATSNPGVINHNRVPGNNGIWVGIFCILVEFMMLFTAYFIARVHNPESFLNGPDKLVTLAGTTITLFLLSSGYCMVKAINAIRSNRSRAAFRWIVMAIILGFAYSVGKLVMQITLMN